VVDTRLYVEKPALGHKPADVIPDLLQIGRYPGLRFDQLQNLFTFDLAVALHDDVRQWCVG
jgi:hypothetical protein